MKTSPYRIGFAVTLTASAIMAVSLLARCVGMRTEGEKRARRDQEAAGRVFRPGGERTALPKLETNAPLHDFLPSPCPIIFWATGRGSDVIQPMAIPSVGGMVVSLLITIFIAPCLFCAVEERKWKRAQRISAKGVVV